MNILILGNGFDLALGLPTKYTDFLEFAKVIEELYPDGVKPNIDLIQKIITNAPFGYFSSNGALNRDDIINKLGRAFASENNALLIMNDFHFCIHRNAWITYFYQRYMQEQIGGDNWIDIEKEIKDVIQYFSLIRYTSHMERLPNLRYREKAKHKKRIYISAVLKLIREHKNSIETDRGVYFAYKERFREDFCRFVCAFEIYLDFFVRHSLKSNAELPKILYNVKEPRILSFNYTSFYSDLLTNTSSAPEMCFVHGRLSYLERRAAERREKGATYTVKEIFKENNIIIGFDEYLDENKKNEQLELVYYRKYFQRIAKGTGSEYLGWLSEYQYQETAKERFSDDGINSLESRMPNHVYICGHSMDPTDKEIFKDILLREPNDTKVTIYYHDEDAHERIITNLIAIIGQDRLIEKTYSRGPQGADIEIIPQ